MSAKSVVNQIYRILPDLCISTTLLFFYVTGAYLFFSPTLQTIILKAVLVSLGFLHAHIVGKIAFPSVSWGNVNEDHYEKILRIVLYAVFVYTYGHGG